MMRAITRLVFTLEVAFRIKPMVTFATKSYTFEKVQFSMINTGRHEHHVKSTRIA